ncbi:hypothetical protein B2G71_08590 [Novosphingobium sp. PC22D]|uniref:hybrid sensor histidine kinase/response regulator n=1 Tax=Novosphingobium sp. PC22D TaxID=1962403 RepID=UPI000BF07240|nr:hybrid sensor histidine kinase/response regulator [Novosphingobium sp. PC22D]PEQ12890.1 hypothetical protein B2G71_08590 [Novosphingobium sp. PC22D]
MTVWIVPLTAIAYAALLFWIANLGDRPRADRFADRHGPVISGLALCVYCTSWTFYGAVGSASAAGWSYLPIYLGPILLFTVFGRFVARVLHTGKAQHSTSIADFLSSRYGKSAWVAALVTLIALAGALPYMALQLKSVSQTLSVLSPGFSEGLGRDNVVLVVAAAMASFAVLFGTGRVELTGHNRGMVIAIAFESVVKFIALGAVALFAAIMLLGEPTADVLRFAGATFAWSQFDLRFLVMTLVAAMASLCLPRQFHMLVVEARESTLAGAARWLFPLYLLMVSAAVVPVVLAGGTLGPGGVPADMLVLALPLSHDAYWLAVLAFIGGLSASTGMIIVTSIALSNMVTNDVLVPLFFRDQMRPTGTAQPLGQVLITIRRATIAGLLVLSLVYVRAIGADATLAGLGGIAFAGVAQFAPGLLLGMSWRKANRAGMVAGLIVGFILWALLLAIPVLGPGYSPPMLGDDPLVSGIVVSLSANLAAFVLFSLASETALIDRVQAIAYVDQAGADLGRSRLVTRTRVADFRLLLEQFVGERQTRDALNRLRLQTGQHYLDSQAPDAQLVETAEKMLASILGSSSARTLILSTLEGDPVSLERLVAMFDETSQRLQFGAELLQIAIENIDQGVSVVDGEQRLVAWNSRYVSMFAYPAGLVEVGRPIADLLRFNMRQLGVPEEAIERGVGTRLQHLRQGTRHSTERELADGRILRILGNPAPNGGYVTSYTDVTADRKAEQALEARVRERTEQLIEANAALEAATRSKTRFLAAASHDLVQPMNAARLFASALAEDIDPGQTGQRALLGQIDRSIETADRLLRALLDISRLDGGKTEVDAVRFALDQAFADIANEFELQAEAKGLALTVMPSGVWLETDRGLFVSLLQNLVKNAVRYSDRCRILVGARRRGADVEILVVDQGRGIAEEHLEAIFDEFMRVPGSGTDEGLGLGLAIVRRIAAMLGTRVAVTSRPGKGSTFSFRLPMAEPGAARRAAQPERGDDRPVEGARVLCVDDDADSLDAVASLLRRWGFDVAAARDPGAVAGLPVPDLVVMDYRLDAGLTGDVAVERLREGWAVAPPTVLLTAEDTAETKAAADRIGATRLIKPAAPPALRALVTSLLKQVA